MKMIFCVKDWMRHHRFFGSALASLFVMLFCASLPTVAQAQKDADSAFGPLSELYPSQTVAYFEVNDVPALLSSWEKMQLGQLAALPGWKPFLKSVRKEMALNVPLAHEAFAELIFEVSDNTSGRLAAGLIKVAPPKADLTKLTEENLVENLTLAHTVVGHVISVADVSNTKADPKNRAEFAAGLEKSIARLVKNGAKVTAVDPPAGCSAKLRKLVLPPAKENPNPLVATLYDFVLDIPAVAGRGAKTYYGISDDLATLNPLLTQLDKVLRGTEKTPSKSLYKTDAFSKIVKRCTPPIGNTSPQMTWFGDPIVFPALIYAAQELHNPEVEKIKAVLSDVLRLQGFSGVKGLGGTIFGLPAGYEAVMRTFAYTPQVYPGILQAFQFVPGKGQPAANNDPYVNFLPEIWVPSTVSGYTCTHIDNNILFENAGPLINEVVAQLGTPPLCVVPATVEGAKAILSGKVPSDIRQALINRKVNKIVLGPYPQVFVSPEVRRSRWRILGAGKPLQIRFSVSDGKPYFTVYQILEFWDSIINGFKEDVDVNLKQAVTLLDTRISILADYLPPRATATAQPSWTDSERVLLAIKIKPGNEAKIIAELKKWFRGAKGFRFFQTPAGDRYQTPDGRLDIWQRKPPEPKKGEKPPLADVVDGAAAEQPGNANKPNVTQIRGSAFAIAVHDGHLMVASHLDYLQYIIRKQQEAKDPNLAAAQKANLEQQALVNSVMFKRVKAECKQLNFKNITLFSYQQLQRSAKPFYMQIKAGDIFSTKSRYGRLLSNFRKEEDLPSFKNVNQEGLPDYGVVIRHLGSAGCVATYSDDPQVGEGWFFQGMLFK